LNSLSLVDLEFMLISCCNATYKIYGLSDEVNEEDICVFLATHYDDDSRINISQMLKWCYKI
jgi:microtubule-associated protein-like 5